MSNRSRLSRYLWGVVPAAALAGGTVGALAFGPGASRPVTAQEKPALTASQLNVASSLEGAFMRISDTVGPATVSITATESASAPSESSDDAAPRRQRGRVAPPEDGDDPFGGLFDQEGSPFRGFRAPQQAPRQATATGSGVIVRPDGYILTNDHVVELANNGQVTVTLSDGTTYKGTVKRDPRSDLALVKINADKPLPYVKLADSSKVHVGQWAIAIGSPFGQQNTMTTGIVSAMHRKRQIGDGGSTRLYPNLIQTDASINPGNSGGPLLNINGEVVGVNVAIFSPTGTNLGIGYAIPSNTARNVMDQLIKNGRVTRGSLGIVPDDVPAGLRRRLGTSNGAYVTQVWASSPAQRGGIQADDVVTRFGNQEITSEADLREAIAQTTPGTSVPVQVLRDGKTVSLTVVPEALKEDAVAAATPPAESRRRPTSALGFDIAPLDAESTQEMKLPTGTRGVQVQRVQAGSLAAQADLAPSMVITAANGTPTPTVDALNRVLTSVKSGDTITLRALRAVVEERGAEPRLVNSVVNITLP